jgi:hypothetical protein
MPRTFTAANTSSMHNRGMQAEQKASGGPLG